MKSCERAALEPGRHHGWDHQETDPEAPLQVSERAGPVPSAGRRLWGTGRRSGLCRCCWRPRPASGTTRRAAGLRGPGYPPGAAPAPRLMTSPASHRCWVDGVGWDPVGLGSSRGLAAERVPLTEDWGVCACVCR